MPSQPQRSNQGGTQADKAQIKVCLTVHGKSHYIMEETRRKMKVNEPGRQQPERNPGSVRSIQSCTYSDPPQALKRSSFTAVGSQKKKGGRGDLNFRVRSVPLRETPSEDALKQITLEQSYGVDSIPLKRCQPLSPSLSTPIKFPKRDNLSSFGSVEHCGNSPY